MEQTLNIETPLDALPGVGPQRGKALARLGLTNIGELLRYYPRGYEDRSRLVKIDEAEPDEAVCVEAVVAHTPIYSHIRAGLGLIKLKVVDETGQIQLTFFNQQYVKNALQMGESYYFYGKIEGDGLARTMTNPAFESVKRPRFLGRIMPIYSLTAGVSNNLLAGLSLQALDCAAQLPDRLPAQLRLENELCELEYAIKEIHFPSNMDEQAVAARRLAFEELFFLSLGLAFLKERRTEQEGLVFSSCPLGEFAGMLPFSLTGAQRRVIEELTEDLQRGSPMNRLVQGDVGSGKTAVAAAAAYFAHCSGYQSAMMAPTEILAEQHFQSLSKLLAPCGMRLALLTGSMRAAEKRGVYQALETGAVDLVVGTHALISQGLQYQNLGLVITDEQHRFGVHQRAALLEKGEQSQHGAVPHGLVMSATPIPRTLALMIYGDLDISIIDELPPGRTPIKTYLMRSSKRKDLFGFLDARIAEGRQAYIVCPMIEQSEETASSTAELKAVTSYAELVQAQLPARRIAVLHGKMKPKEKEQVMRAFSAGETDILVSTTVIEVGVDVPNATVMVIENAERFGLSQLHQLRGRVGRGAQESSCFLVSDNTNEETRARLKTLRDSTDGFAISEADLRLRGPGDFFGSRQHGLPEMRLADLSGDMRLLRQAQDAAAALLRRDPQLEQAEHRGLLDYVKELFAEQAGMFN